LIGTGLVTVMAMTATVSYAIQPVPSPGAPEAPPAPPVPPTPPVPPAVPQAPTAPVAPDAPVVKDGVYIYTVKRGDNTIVLRLDGPTDQGEIERRVSDAEARRAMAEGDRAMADGDRAMAAGDRAMAIAERNRVEAGNRARLVVVRTGSPEDYRIEMGRGQRIRIQTHDCEGKARSDAFMTQTETRGGNVTRTKVVTCGQVMPDEAQIAANIEMGMAEGRKHMELARVEIRRAKGLSASERAEALRDIDEGLREMREGLAEARRELRREMEQSRRELRQSMSETN